MIRSRTKPPQRSPKLRFRRPLSAIYGKLANYLGSQLAPEWGGCYWEHWDWDTIRDGQGRFFEWGKEKMPRVGRHTKLTFSKVRDGPWGPDTCQFGVVSILQHEPKPEELPGILTEPYLSVGSRIITMASAARVLQVKSRYLIKLKHTLILDPLVWDEAVNYILSKEQNHVPERDWQRPPDVR